MSRRPHPMSVTIALELAEAVKGFRSTPSRTEIPGCSDLRLLFAYAIGHLAERYDLQDDIVREAEAYVYGEREDDIP